MSRVGYAFGLTRGMVAEYRRVASIDTLTYKSYISGRTVRRRVFPAMPDSTVRVVDVYPYRKDSINPEFLLLHRAPDTEYAGQWRMVGGKIEAGEAAWETAHREVMEETGQSPSRLWTIPSVNAFYEWENDRINLIPAFAAALPGDPVLDDEHDAFAWLPAQEATSRLSWPEQKRLLRLADRFVRDGIPPRLVIHPDQ